MNCPVCGQPVVDLSMHITSTHPDITVVATTQANERMRAESGDVIDPRRLVGFLYLLLRDHMTAGMVESMVGQLETRSVADTHYANGWIARYAIDLTNRLEH